MHQGPHCDMVSSVQFIST